VRTFVAAVALLLAACTSAPVESPSPTVSPTSSADGQFFHGEGTVEVSGTEGTCEGPVAMGVTVFDHRVTVLIETGVSVQPDGSCIDEGLGGPADFEFDGPPPERDGSWQAAGSNAIIQWDVQGRLGVASSVLAGVILIQGGAVGGSITLQAIGLSPSLCTDETARLCASP
jgi:hypothetical protein